MPCMHAVERRRMLLPYAAAYMKTLLIVIFLSCQFHLSLPSASKVMQSSYVVHYLLASFLPSSSMRAGAYMLVAAMLHFTFHAVKRESYGCHAMLEETYIHIIIIIILHIHEYHFSSWMNIEATPYMLHEFSHERRHEVESTRRHIYSWCLPFSHIAVIIIL